MNLVVAVFLGVLQGLTEFLPVSSSGHLVLAQRLFPFFEQPGVLFEVILHAATLLSIIFFYRKDLVILTKKYWKMILIGTIPVILVGLGFRNSVDLIFNKLRLVGLALLFTALINFWIDERSSSIRSKYPKLFLGLVVGVFQSIAIIPGISRSASTIFAGYKFGMKKNRAIEFSFLLSIPAILGANVLEIIKLETVDGLNFSIYFVGFLSAFLSGYFAISLVYKILKEKKFKLFAYYCAVLGIIILFL